MALGRHKIKVDLDTASDPDDTTLLVAQGEGETVYLMWVDVIITTLEASTRVVLEDGVGGDEVLVASAVAVGTQQFRWNAPGQDGLPLTAETLLNATTIGGTALAGRIVGEVEVRGGL